MASGEKMEVSVRSVMSCGLMKASGSAGFSKSRKFLSSLRS